MPGVYNSLSQTVLKITMPGVPDFYQGTELWDLSLVDPDNRGPVDYERRRALLAEISGQDDAARRNFIAASLKHPESGALKLLVTTHALRHRRDNRDRFERGAYVPLAADGPRARHVVAFARTLDAGASIVVAGRFFAALSTAAEFPLGEVVWAENRIVVPASIPARQYREIMTGKLIDAVEEPATGRRRLKLDHVFSTLPVAILEPA
jgi:(1->4)-alpha-D-glucan 1-alpha-D-glucosylmutase